MEPQIFESEVDRLATLQEMDRILKEKDEIATVLRGEIDEWSGRLLQQRDELARLTAERDLLDRQRLDLEAKLDVEAGKVKDSRMKMARARNERESLALQHQINVAKEISQQLEEQIVAFMERLEVLGVQMTAAKESLAALESSSEQELLTRRVRLEEITVETTLERTRRDGVVDGMNVTLRSRYEQILTRRGGSAVAVVKGGTCQGCHVSVPPQLFNELKKFRDVRQCPNCHRILYWKPEGDGAAA